ncbi:arginyltransferase [Gammaproteobacteria bacterium 45_16_T64]|nr:arginyltransferase [Gammaproteobacteria bacterium 45_16_T64]
MTDLAAVKFFITPLHKCSYLPRQDAITLFADPKAEVDKNLYSDLSELGFRRSGNYLYRPHCRQCSACIPVRIPSATFKLSRKQKRVLKKNADLAITAVEPKYSEEHYELYRHYIEKKHHDGDMYPPSQEQYASFLLSDWGNTTFYEFRDCNSRLLAVSVCDILENGISAVYTFYDVNEPKRSLGVMAVLWQIEEAKRIELPAVYLGYWIKECQKMSYKTDYKPLEMLIDDRWVQTNPLDEID